MNNKMKPLGYSIKVVQGELKLSVIFAHSLRFCKGFGMTELSPASHLLSAKDADRKQGSVGPLLANMEARIIANDDNEIIDALPGAPGELWIRGPIVMKVFISRNVRCILINLMSISQGYWKNKSATDAMLTADGWLKTGDIAVVDDEGFFTIVDRKKELIKYKGFQGELLWLL
jgi:4-coumarate--CoA ligase